MSNASGLGGGLLFIPVLLLILNFYPHEAIPISKIVIFAGALTSFIQNTKVKRPHRNCKALNYNLIIVNTSNLLLGTVFGVTLNKILPNTLILFLLCILLFYYSYKTFKTFLKFYNEEANTDLHSMSSQMNSISPRNTNNDINQPIDQVEREIYKDQFLLRWDKLQYVLFPFLIMAILSILRESNIVSKCSLLYWVLILLFALTVIIFDYFVLLHIEKEYNYRKLINFPYDAKDINWNRDTIIKLNAIGFIAGFIAGTIGIGGGVVLGPILLDLGIHPIVGTVTTNFLVLITSSSTTFQFILFEMLNFQYGF